LLSGGRVLAAAREEMARGQAERLMPLLSEVLEAGGAAPRDLDAIGVGTGPGNFTGIRISVAAARGLALSLNVPAVGVTTLEAQALDAPGPHLASVDARRGQVYLQRFGAGAERGPDLVATDAAGDWGHPDLTVSGDMAEALAEALGARPALSVPPLAVAIARIAAARFRIPGLPRPAPLYLRGADAAPPAQGAPALMP
jgi:tRNA threonylcarbamoyl adenosine modification protein YeaZ